MIKRITTYILLMLFVVSTTSFPMNETMCKMKGNFIGLSCPMMNHSMNKNSKSCEGQENSCSGNSSINSNNSCCTTRMIDNSIKDIYLVHDNKINIHQDYQLIRSVFCLPALYRNYLQAEIVFNDTSPETMPQSDLFITNSVFLI